MIINDLFTNKKTKVSEGMAGKVMFRGTGADGGTYEIIQSGPTDFMIHANGKHIDTYGSLQRAMSVLQNEVPGLQQGMAEGSLNELAPSSGEGGNGPFDYGSAIIEIGQNFVDNYADSAAGEDAADIIQVGKTFMSAGMTKGISALFAIDTQVYGHVLDELSSLGFNVDLDIVSKRRAPTLDRDAQNAMRAVQAKFDAQPGQVYLVTGHHEFGSSSGKIKATSPEAAKQKFIANAGMKFNKVDVASEQGMAEGRFQDDYPEYGGKDKNKAMTYDRNAGLGYEGEPWSDSNSNWSGDNPNYADSTYEPEPVILQGPDGKQTAFSPDSPEVQGVYDREYGIKNKLGQITKAFQKGIDFNANRPTPYTNLATSDSTNDFSDPIKLGQYDVDFPEQTVDKFDAQSGQFNQQVIPSPNNPNAPFQKPVEPVKAKVPAADGSSNSATRSLNAKPDSNSAFVLYDPIKQQPVTQADQKSSNKLPTKTSTPKAVPIPANPRPGSWQELAKLNNITDPRKLKANTYIKTPDGEEVYVKKGDTLSGLAQRMRSKPGMSEQAPLINVPPGQQATTQPDGSTRISKPGSVSRADYAKNMAAYKAQTQTPENIADFKQRMASGQGYADTERQANLQQQQQHFGKYADTGDLDEGDGFDDITTFSDLRTTDQGGKTNQTYSSTTIAKNPTTGQQQSLASWDHTDPKTGKNYSGTNYIDPQGNADVQKNYKESKKIKVDEVSLGDYPKKAAVSQAGAKIKKFFGRDDPAAVAAADRTIANRTKGLARADARRKPYTVPPVDQDKQRRDLADKYPNIDELVRRAELRRDPQYDRADGQAYYDGRDAEQNYHKLKQIQRMIRGAELDEMNFGGVSQATDSATGDITTSFNQGPVSVSQTKTPGGYTKQTDQQFNLGTATVGARTFGPNIGAGQLAGTTTKTATNNMTGQAKQQVKGVGFGGASGATVGKNYVGSSDDELARHAADSTFDVNEDPNQATLNVPGQTPPVNKTNQSKSPSMYDIDKANRKEIASQFDPKSTYVNPYDKNTKALDKGSKAINTMADFEESSVNESIDRIRHLAGIKPVR